MNNENSFLKNENKKICFRLKENKKNNFRFIPKKTRISLIFFTNFRRGSLLCTVVQISARAEKTPIQCWVDVEPEFNRVVEVNHPQAVFVFVFYGNVLTLFVTNCPFAWQPFNTCSWWTYSAYIGCDYVKVLIVHKSLLIIYT